MRLISKHTTMTSKEILKADVIDIIFENRNKSYGAYALRKHYNTRMSLALGIAVSSVVLIVFLVQPSGQSSPVTYNLPDAVELIDIVIPPDEPVEPSPPPQQDQTVAQIQYTSEIVFTQDETNVASVNDLQVNQISTTTMDGLPPTDIATPVDPPTTTANGPIGEPDLTPRFDPIEVQPSFPGGMNAWISFLQRHLRVPEELEPGIKITVLVKFIVGTDGSIDNFEVVQSGGSSFDREVIRVLKKMPKWTPAMQNGHPAATSFTQPVSFQVYEQ